jgi:predicted signal transduction protein with EAL and GGDEF domain
MYAAKHAGRNRYSYFTSALQQASEARMRLITDMHGALADGQFRVYYQPIVELSTGHVHKAEALVRWQHPVRGLLGPEQFIPIADRHDPGTRRLGIPASCAAGQALARDA